MRCRWTSLPVLILTASVVLGIAVAPVAAIGYWNLPGNVCQFMGCGYGPGYHAPMVLGPNSCCGGSLRLNEVRLRYAPRSPYELCASCDGATWAGPFEQSPPATCVAPPTMAPETMPTPSSDPQSAARAPYGQSAFPAFVGPPL